MIRAVVFDMDGVLIDSEPVYMEEVIRTLSSSFDLAKNGIEQVQLEKDLKRLVGSPNQKTYRIIAECLNHKYSAVQIEAAFAKTANSAFKTDYQALLNPHLLNILPKLKSHDLKLAIASSSPLANILEVIETCQIAEYFDVVTSGLDFKESKPNPEVYLTTLEKLGVKPHEAIALEDSTYGIKACNNANIKVIALSDLRFGFDQSQADYLVYDLLEAYNIIKRMI